MEKEYFISYYLDTRRELRNHKYPVKLNVFTRVPRKQKLYPTKFEFTEDEFKSTWQTIKPRENVKLKRAEMQSSLDAAEKVAATLTPFSFEEFEKLMFMKAGNRENVFYQYEQAINAYKVNNQLGTASNYLYSMKALKNYLKGDNKEAPEPEVLYYRQITPKWLEGFERYMIQKGKSQTTTGIFLRPLRSLFNSAISEGIIKQDIYPFGRRKYEIPAPKAVKKALTRDQLKKLYEAQPATPEQAKAKDFFYFLFNTAGMNVKDMAGLKYENLKGGTLEYYREKTKRTTKKNLTPIVVHLNTFALEFITKYGNPVKEPGTHIFDIYKPGMTEQEKFRQSLNFVRFINQHIKKLAKANDLPESISTYWSRHSFATLSIKNGASLELISQALNHKDMATTKGYFAGFETDTMKDLTNNLMNF